MSEHRTSVLEQAQSTLSALGTEGRNNKQGLKHEAKRRQADDVKQHVT